jgi:serine phosphatase RsbU (regulator of sigma subunit)
VLESRTPAIIDDASADVALNRAQSIVQSNIRAAICAPLSAQTRVLGALYADYPGRARLYKQTDLDFFGAFAGIAAFALENARLQEDARERAKLQRDLEIAGEIQLGLLPDDSFAHPGVEIDWTYRPSKQIGGDFYDCTPLEGGRLAMVLGDVSGKSVAAALFMARTMSFFRSLLREDPSPAVVLTECNKLLGIRTDRVMFATACYILVDPLTHQARFASAGHNPVLVYSPEHDTFAEFGASGPPLGIAEDATYSEQTIDLPVGSVVVLYTDGIVEARNQAGAFFGLPAVRDLVRQTAKGSPHDVTAALLRAVENHWIDSTYIRDDFALLIAKITH